jgi:hypothetical protein
LLLGFAVAAAAQEQVQTFAIDCWSGGHCAMPCGGGATGNYDCSDGTGGWSPTCPYTDPLPSGATVTMIEAVLFTHQCASSTSLTATVNGQTIGSTTEARSSCSCLSSPCLDTRVQSASYPAGFPGYVAGGSNTFGITLSGLICVEHVELTLHYTTKKLEIVRPTADQDFDLGPQNFTATDPVTFEARLTPPDAARSVDWNVLLEYQTSGGRGASENRRTFQTQAGRTHDETYQSMGGRLTVNANAVINSQTVNADPVTATITGVPIADNLITARLETLYRNGDTPRLPTGISQVESTYRQFAVITLYNRADRWPTESFDGGSHIGLMQMPVAMEVAWNWESNTRDGVSLFEEKVRTAHRLMRRIIQANRGLRQLTGVELENMGLVLYGPHASGDLSRQYYAPAPTPGGGVDWVVNTAGNAAGVAYADNCRGSMH